ncbi:MULTISPECIES: hypothetical protein [Streptococcus]|jgi:hypothetical protein|uniref:hypothetical protein n=1 Tax=Streptococcus TaxID=1301 RepID=UPI001106219B|nr:MULTISPECIES: hypothetical protein [Streptococcus]MDU2559809.1 hypothetical protein [Streptococcus mitis]
MKKILITFFAILSLFFYSSVFADDTNTIVSETMTAQQLVNQYATDYDITLEQASDLLGINLYERSSQTYRTISTQITVTNSYKPSISFYCETSEYGTYHGIIRILRTEINRNYNGMSKQFSGSLYVNLEQADRIFYIINGDFFDNGTTTLSGGLNIGIGESASVNLGGSYVDNHYKYVYHEGRVHF